MAQVTYYVALPFRQIDGEITAGEPQECRDAFKPDLSRQFWPAIRITAGPWRSRGPEMWRLGNSGTP